MKFCYSTHLSETKLYKVLNCIKSPNILGSDGGHINYVTATGCESDPCVIKENTTYTVELSFTSGRHIYNNLL